MLVIPHCLSLERGRHFVMFNRAEIWSVLALLAGVLAFSGFLGSAAAVVQVIALLCAGVCCLSLLFGLFEPAEEEEQSISEDPLRLHSGR